MKQIIATGQVSRAATFGEVAAAMNAGDTALIMDGVNGLAFDASNGEMESPMSSSKEEDASNAIPL